MLEIEILELIVDNEVVEKKKVNGIQRMNPKRIVIAVKMLLSTSSRIFFDVNTQIATTIVETITKKHPKRLML